MSKSADVFKFLKKSRFWVLIFILLTAVFFRFFNMPDRYVFDFDPTRDALISIHASENLKFPLTGAQSGIADFTFGPWYYYQIILFSLLTPFQFAPWILIGISSVVTVFVYFLIGKYLYNSTFGLVTAAVVALAPSEIGPVTGLSNPNLIPLNTALAVLLFVVYIKYKHHFLLLFIWGFIIGMAINHHYQAVGLLFLPIVAFMFKRKHILKVSGAFVSGLVISFIPLLVFNLTENWHTVYGFQEYISSGRNTSPNRWITYLYEFWPNFWAYVIGTPLIFGYIIFGFVLFVHLIAYRKKSVDHSYTLLMLVFLINVLFIRYATSVRENYYFLYIHPFIFLLWAFTIWYSLKMKYFQIMTIVLVYSVFFYNLREDIRRLPDERESMSLRNRISILEQIYPNGVAVFRCGDRIAHTAQATVFFLHHSKRLSEDGTLIGFKSDQCMDTAEFTVMPFDEKHEYILLDFETYPRSAQYWTPVTAEKVYKDNLIGEGK